jgi:hypothetical protein
MHEASARSNVAGSAATGHQEISQRKVGKTLIAGKPVPA